MTIGAVGVWLGSDGGTCDGETVGLVLSCCLNGGDVAISSLSRGSAISLRACLADCCCSDGNVGVLFNNKWMISFNDLRM